MQYKVPSYISLFQKKRKKKRNPDITVRAQDLTQQLLVGEPLCNCDHNIVEVNFVSWEKKTNPADR